MTGIRDPIDLLPRVTSAGGSGGGGGSNFPARPKLEAGSAEKVELSLGLSLNGGFWPERKQSAVNNRNNKLFRASSVTEFVDFPVDVELSLYTPLTRTCSLPPETEVEQRKRKELQSLRRSEAKRRRVEKLKNVIGEDLEANRRKLGVGKKKQSLSPPLPLPSVSSSPAAVAVRLPSQGSIGSQESGGSSGVTDLESQAFAGTNKERCETNEHSEPNKTKRDPKVKADKDCAYDDTMPCVTTKEEGPDGKRIQGFLYRYGKGEEVRIVCVCHGSFLTPADFVKHGGGGDVDHPLRHILVTSLFR